MNQTIKILRNGISYGVAMFVLAYIFGTYYHFSSQDTLLASSFMSIAALLANGLIHRKYTKPVKVLQAINITLQDSETVKLQTPANHTMDENAVPGKLFLTDKRLAFVPCQQDEQTQQVHSWSLTDQHSFKFYPTIFNAGGEFIINCSDHQLVFEVDELKAWKRSLLEK
ncbi:hypothetical protein [Pinibacter soli]|uniref:GRAM domain-containing protein n=1 Tax=Pinibacter soli TaxID=3044211 RepID=A0ABT6RF50_9BACT|nr:hypothetical protein [Pinibacter soli]MDI3321199.1 hypothetical protein [Pinibacter soli]